MRISFDLVLFILTAGPIIICLVSLKALQWFRKRRPRRAPFNQRLERTPGAGLLHKIDDLSEEIMAQTVALIVLPVILYAGNITHFYITGRSADPVRVGLLVGVGLAVCGIFLFTNLRMIKLRRALRLGYMGKLSVGQRLNRMMLEGYRVYHDFPAKGFNINHILVGPKGVFAIATQTRAQPDKADRQGDATVTYDGRMLHFPTYSSHEMIDQAKRQGKWLARWLSQAVGEPLTTRAIIALPGWFVKRTSPDGLPVVNPKQFASLFQHILPRPTSPETMARIVHQLDQRCNDNPTEAVINERQ